MMPNRRAKQRKYDKKKRIADIKAYKKKRKANRRKKQ